MTTKAELAFDVLAHVSGCSAMVKGTHVSGGPWVRSCQARPTVGDILDIQDGQVVGRICRSCADRISTFIANTSVTVRYDIRYDDQH